MRYTDLDKTQLAYLLSVRDSRVNNCTVAVSQAKFAGWDLIDLLSSSDSDPVDQVSEDDIEALHRADLLAPAYA